MAQSSLSTKSIIITFGNRFFEDSDETHFKTSLLHGSAKFFFREPLTFRDKYDPVGVRTHL